MTSGVEVLRWPHPRPLPEEEIVRFFAARGMEQARWSNGAGEVYAVHSHSYRKILFCLSGEITFHLPQTNENIALGPGDRLIIPAGVHHSATVGPEGVACIEAGE